MSANSEPLNILSWNCQSISNEAKLTQLRLLLTDYDIHVACLQETFLGDNSKVFVPNYKIYRRDRPTHGGGVAILVRSNIRHTLLKPHNTSIETVSVQLCTTGGNLIVTSAYSPHFTPAFATDLETLTEATVESIIIGDFNAKHTAWNCSTNNRAGKQLHDFINSSVYTLINTDTPTHIPHSGHSPSIIDIAITNSTAPINICPIDRLISDHYPILCKLDTRITTNVTSTFKYGSANWEEYRNFIDSDIINSTTHLNSSTEIDDAIDRLGRLILSAREVSVPKSTHRPHLFKISPDTLSAIRYRNKLRRNWQRAGTPITKNRFRTAINIVDKMIGDLVGRDRNNRWHDFMRRVDNDANRIWKLSRSLRGKRTAAPNFLRHQNVTISTDSEKANAFADIFARAHTTTMNTTHPHDGKVKAFTTKFDRRNFFPDRVNVTSTELSGYINALRPFKAPGNDGIQNILIKNLPESGIKLLAKTLPEFSTHLCGSTSGPLHSRAPR